MNIISLFSSFFSKKFLQLGGIIATIAFLLFSPVLVLAQTTTTSQVVNQPEAISSQTKTQIVSWQTFFVAYFEALNTNDYTSRTRIRFPGVASTSPLADNLRFAIDNKLFPNVRVRIPRSSGMPISFAKKLVNRHLGSIPSEWEQKQGIMTHTDLKLLMDRIEGNHLPFVSSYSKVQAMVPIIKEYYPTLDLTQIQTMEALIALLDDKYAAYLPTQQAKEFMGNSPSGVIGVVISPDPEGIYIDQVIPGLSAQKAGIKSGDIILAIDNISLVGRDFPAIYELLSGNPETSVSLLVKRGNEKKEYTLTRKAYQPPTIQYSMIDGVLLISLAQFTDHSAKEIIKLLTAYKDSMKGLILALDDNPGGEVDEVIEMLDIFLPDNTPLIETIATKKNDIIISQTPNPSLTAILSTIPVIVIINHDSASASEIFASVVQTSHPKSTIIGEQSYGKGTIQEVYEFLDGSLMKFTIGYRKNAASHESIDKQGVTPDVIIDPFTYGDALQKALEIMKKEKNNQPLL